MHTQAAHIEFYADVPRQTFSVFTNKMAPTFSHIVAQDVLSDGQSETDGVRRRHTENRQTDRHTEWAKTCTLSFSLLWCFQQ